MPWKTCTATNALSRPCAGESSASSAALKRSSIGKLTGWRSSAARAARTASTACSRGTRTPSPRSARAARRRRSRRTSRRARAARRPRTRSGSAAGSCAGKRRATSLTARKAWLSSRTSLDVGAERGRACSAGRSVRSCVRVSATSACGKVQNSKWSCASARSCSVVEHVLERLRLVDVAQAERGHAAERDRGDHAERAEATPARRAARRRRSIVRSLPSARISSTLSTWPGEVRQPRAGAVRAGGERAGERLGVDVAEVRHRQPARVQLARERLQADAGLDAHEPGRGVGVEHAVRARRALISVPVGGRRRR